MPSTHIALLRGINVGKAKRIAMADLRRAFEKLGFESVRTLLNSGNVVFVTSKALKENAADAIEAAVANELGVTARLTLVSRAELDRIVAENPLLDVAKNPSRLLVSVLRSPQDAAALKPLAAKKWGAERLAVKQRAAYVWCPAGILDSEVSKAIARALGDSVTSRNWATVLKLQALARSSQ